MADKGLYCRHCGYDLRGSRQTKRCPECGQAFDPAIPATYALRPPHSALRRWRNRLALLLLLLVLTLAGTWGWLYWGWKSEQSAVVKLRVSVSSMRVEPLGGERLKRYLGPAGWVLDRVMFVYLSATTTDADLIHVRQLKGLQELWIGGKQVTDAGLVHLQELPTLRALGLRSPHVTGAGLVPFQELKGLDLGETQVTDADLVHLKELRKLQWLVLFETKVSDAGLAHLQELRGLKQLWLTDTAVTDTGIRDLQAALPECEIVGP